MELTKLKLNESKLYDYYISILIIDSGLLFLWSFLNDSSNIQSASLSIFGILVVISVAKSTLEMMEASTKDTIKTALEVGDKQIQEYKKIAAELKDSNMKLSGVYENLKILVEDVEERQKIRPDLDVRFKDNQKEITLSTDGEEVVEFILHNNGKIMAEDANFEIYFPPEIEILYAEEVVFKKLQLNSKYPNYVGIIFERGGAPGDSHYTVHVKLKIQKTGGKKFKIPLRFLCKDYPVKYGELTIKTIE